MDPKNFFDQDKRFFFDDREAVADYVRRSCMEEFELVRKTADLACQQKFLFQLRWDLEKIFEPVCMDGTINWLYQPGDDAEFVYSFNRMRFWICMGQAYAMTGDEKYAKAFADQLVHWVKTVKPEEPDHWMAWRTIEMGFRMDYWCRAMQYFRGSPSITPEVMDCFVSAMHTHAEKIMGIWDSYQLMSNWGIIANHGLFIAGVMLPESPRTREFRREALRRLDMERRMQIYRDGVQWEQSPMYHNEMLRCLLDIVLLADRNRIELPEGFRDCVHKMALTDLAWQKPSGCEPMMGDSDDIDQRDVMTLAAVVFGDGRLKYAGYPRFDYETVWTLGVGETEAYSRLEAVCPKCDWALPDSGNYFLRSGWDEKDTWVRFHCGTLGAGHGHADQLHFDLTAFGEDILTDLGRFTYVYGPDRREFKDGSGHNTVTVDDKDFYITKDSWECSKLSRAVNQKFWSDVRYGYAEGGHLGYYADGVYVNRRLIFLKPDILIVVDELYADGPRTYQQYFHWNTGSLMGSNNVYRYRGEHAAARLELVSASDVICEQYMGRISRHYNLDTAAPVLKTQVLGDGFASVFTVLSLDPVGEEMEISVEKLPVMSNFKGIQFEDQLIEALRVRKGERGWVVVVAHQEYASPTDTFLAGGCTGFGQAVIFDERAGETQIGTVLLH